MTYFSLILYQDIFLVTEDRINIVPHTQKTFSKFVYNEKSTCFQ